MTGGLVEATLELWASSLRDVKGRIRPLFRQKRMASSAGLFLDALLGPERRKTGWMRAEAAGDPGPWRQQALLGRAQWDPEALRDLVRDYVVETLADPGAVLVIAETGFLKQGRASCGVGRQYTGSAGKIANCQIGVFAAYVSRHGQALIDRALYLPKAWTDDPARRAATHIPPATVFATKPRLAREMIKRAMAAGVPFGWVAGDTIYGVGEIEMALRRAGKGYVLGANATDVFNSWGKTPFLGQDAVLGARRRSWGKTPFLGQDAVLGARRRSWGKTPSVAGTAEAIAAGLEEGAWQRLSAGDGTKGERLYDWAYCELADLDAAEYTEVLSGLWTRGLLIRRSLEEGELAFFSTWCPAGTEIDTLVMVEGRRWAIEDAFETAKTELGLAHNETRSWHGWHRPVSLVMLAFAMMAAVRQRANSVPPPKTRTRPRQPAL
jgi:SRSO17 transposase